PGIHNQVSQSIVAASVESAAYLRSVVNDPNEQTKFRVDAAKTILDRAGHLPFVRPKDDTKPLGPQKDYSEAIAGKSGDALLALILGGESEKPEPEDGIIEVTAHDGDHEGLPARHPRGPRGPGCVAGVAQGGARLPRTLPPAG